MADFSSSVPAEPAKIGEYLHDRDRIPERPPITAMGLLKQWWGVVFGLALGVGLMCAGFEIRDSWKEHRDWVIPLIALGGIIAGLAIGYLLYRGKWAYLAAPLLFAVLAVAFCVFDVWRGEVVDGDSDAGRKTLGVFFTIFFVASAVSGAIAVFTLEAKDPTRAPQAEV
jgi:hypothetical protein